MIHYGSLLSPFNIYGGTYMGVDHIHAINTNISKILIYFSIKPFKFRGVLSDILVTKPLAVMLIG
jgi:hypothetical protein